MNLKFKIFQSTIAAMIGYASLGLVRVRWFVYFWLLPFKFGENSLINIAVPTILYIYIANFSGL